MHRLSVSHLTEYVFSENVSLGPHKLLLRPREGHDIRITSSKLSISPGHMVRWHRDVYNNSVATVTFTETTSRLSIYSEVNIEHYDDMPMDFVIEDYAVNFPFLYLSEEEADLIPYQRPNYPGDSGYLQNWLQQFDINEGEIQTYTILDSLNKWVYQNFTYQVREEPGVQTPYETIVKQSGSCRDFAALLVEATRCLGLASRFVSGYLHSPSTETGNGSTHAWAEVYLPGPGWKGLDPTTGELTDRRHITVAVTRHPEWAPPVSGSFFGSTQVPELHVNVTVNQLP